MIDGFHLRELSRNDLKAINVWRNDPDVVASLGTSFRYINIETDDEWFSSYQRNRSHQVRLIIADNEDIPIGMVSLIQIDWHARNAEFSIQIGDKSCWGKGIGQCATDTMVRHGFNNLNLHRIYLTVLPENYKARRIYQKIGFREEGVLRQTIFKDGSYSDLVLMALLQEEFHKESN